MRLTPMSSRIASAALTSDGETLYFLSAFEGGYDLWKKEIPLWQCEYGEKLNCFLASSLLLDKGGKNLYILGRRPSKMTLPVVVFLP